MPVTGTPRTRPELLLALVLLLGPAGAAAQGLGLDLGEEEAGDDGKKEAPAAAEPPPAAEDLSADDRPDPAAEASTEAEVTQGDRVKAVQRKHFLKSGRVDVAPTVGFSLNDPFRPKLSYGAALGFHMADSLALRARYDRYHVAENDTQRIAKRELRAILPFSNLLWSAGADLVWTPIYGKLAFFNGIVQYDLFLATGLGVAWSQTSEEPVKDGAHPAASVGIGQRFAFADFMALQLGLRQLLYADRPGNREISEIQKVLTLEAGLSFWIPPSFEYGR